MYDGIFNRRGSQIGVRTKQKEHTNKLMMVTRLNPFNTRAKLNENKYEKVT